MTTDDTPNDLVRAARGGLCGVCTSAKLIKSSRGSLFVLCEHPEPPKYPPQPVVRCGSFRPRAE
ncbi:MAG: hypothetical protein U5L04_14595 [Trueperaceae bacterium]|nr:hypothetical protein [Trueperaceae bacterium]